MRFESGAGTGLATWTSTRVPEVGARYSVEFDIDGVIDRHCAREGTGGACRIGHTDSETKLEGLLESVDSDGTGYFRLAPDSLTMLDTSDGWDRPGAWLEITLSVDRLMMTPVGGA